MNAPQIIYIVLIALSIYDATENHGKPRSNYNVFSTIVSSGIIIALLIWGGFFN